MRRALTILLAAAVLSTMGTGSASAGTRSHSMFFYGSWRSHHRVDADTVDRDFWYVSAYTYGDHRVGFAYHFTLSCTTTDGKKRCHRDFNESGRVRQLTTDQFSIDRKLSSAHFAATITLRSKNAPNRIADVALDLTGTGIVTRTKESYSYRQGCELYKFNGHSRYRRAEGTPTITIGGVDQKIGKERRTTIGSGDSVSIEKEC
jgi:hypothetical protein